ncbi:MAG TPA: reverse transcriptase-like protein, partial [bacterium]|nr:reverse transcriptase-like protein [bacterium]
MVDGGSRGNPGPSAIGVVIKDAQGKVLAEIGEYIGELTNNVAEYRALLRALEEAKAMGAGA